MSHSAEIIIIAVLSFLLGAFCIFGIIETSADVIYMDENNPANPGSYGGLAITYEVKWIADSLYDPQLTTHEQVLKDMQWVSDNIEFTPPPPRMAHPSVIIESGVGLCGDYAIVVTSLLACQDIPSKIIGMYNQTVGAHVIIEVYYNGTWHVYGPTHQSYWERDGNVLSFDELKNGGALTAELHYTPNGISTDYLLDPEIYMLSNPAGEIGPEHPMWWPLTIDREYIVPPIGYYAAGSRHIGATYTNNCHNWSITNLTQGKEYSFVIYPKEIRGTDVFVLRVNETGCYNTTGDPIYINFTAQNETENLHIWHPYTGTEHVLMMVEKYEVV